MPSSGIFALHGFTGSPASWDTVRALAPTEWLCSEWQCSESQYSESQHSEWLCPSLLGHDEQELKIKSFEEEIDRLADLLRGFSSGHRPGGIRLVGYSLGGRLALGLLARHTELFSSALLIGASPGLRSKEERTTRLAADEALARRLEQDGLEAFLDHWQSIPLFASQQRLPAEVLAAQHEIRSQHRSAGLAQALRVLGLARMPDWRPELKQIDLPITLMTGEEDGKFRALAEEMAGLLPNASHEVVAGAGHNVVLERPAEVARSLYATRNGLP